LPKVTASRAIEDGDRGREGSGRSRRTSRAIKEKTNALAQASMKLGEAMYAAQQDAGAEGAAPKKDDVVDADFDGSEGRQEEERVKAREGLSSGPPEPIRGPSLERGQKLGRCPSATITKPWASAATPTRLR
jgi:hypothetical protein